MALPPEPIEEVLPQAALIVEAEVESVLESGPAIRSAEAAPGATSVPGRDAPQQTVKLRVTKVHKGPFLLDDSRPHPVILGRYGPDSWNLERILGALKASAI